MFKFDKPISNKEEDVLNRKKFSSHLGNALLTWEEKESLVIALYGEWGAGKSSSINLAKEHIEESEKENKPTIIEFNPWFFSNLDNLSKHFFNEIATELEIKNDDKKDKEIADKLKQYAKLLQIIPEKRVLSDLSSKFLFGLSSLLSISASQIIPWINLSAEWLEYSIFGLGLIFGLIFVLISFFGDFLLKLSDYFSHKANVNKKSISKLKKEIKNHLSEREKKLVIVIDDIDRLNQSEIRQMFRLVRVNGDFPNTIYLLAFDRKIIEANLEEQVGVSGKDYLEKIVQVSFDIPVTKADKIERLLIEELNRILDTLPDSHEKFFDKYDFTNIYHSGFKELFKNIRDVKRFISSLQFNISQMHQKDVMEVNPVDFIAIEAIRVFSPDFYNFLKSRKHLFTDTELISMSSYSYDVQENTRKAKKKEIKEQLDKLDPHVKNHIEEILYCLFPQVESFCNEYSRKIYPHEWQSKWNKRLRVCATQHFDSYFTLIPGGDEEELSQYEIEQILSSMYNTDQFEKLLNDYVEQKKIKKVLERIQDYTNDSEKIPQNYFQNIVQALFNISDNLPKKEPRFLDINSNIEIRRVIYQLFKRENNKEENYKILEKTISCSKGILGPIETVFQETSKDENETHHNSSVPEQNLSELQTLCVEKIKGLEKETLLKHEYFIQILYRLKEWGEEEEWQNFIFKIQNDEKLFWLFLQNFILENEVQIDEYHGYRTNKKFNYQELKIFLDLDEVNKKITEAKDSPNVYNKNKEIIDLFLSNKNDEDDEDNL